MRGRGLSVAAIVRSYTTKIRPRAESELAWFGEQPDLKSAVRLAALAVMRSGKRYSHQRRIKRASLQSAWRTLSKNQSRLTHSTSFEQLFTLLDAILNPIAGIGELYIYDTALRLGAKLGHLPRRVFLHAGTRAGARALGMNTSEGTLPVKALPAALRALEPHEIEDVLCIFKDELAGTRATHIKKHAERSWCA
jgi:hypothetical protein